MNSEVGYYPWRLVRSETWSETTRKILPTMFGSEIASRIIPTMFRSEIARKMLPTMFWSKIVYNELVHKYWRQCASITCDSERPNGSAKWYRRPANYGWPRLWPLNCGLHPHRVSRRTWPNRMPRFWLLYLFIMLQFIFDITHDVLEWDHTQDTTHDDLQRTTMFWSATARMILPTMLWSETTRKIVPTMIWSWRARYYPRCFGARPHARYYPL